MMNPNLYAGLTLAYMGDAVYEVKVRKTLLDEGLIKINDLHKTAINFTRGEFQAKLIRHLVSNNLVTEEEMLIYKRGRNSHVKNTRKTIKLSDYLDATGFESLIGYLHLTDNESRINELIQIAFELNHVNKM